MMDNGWFAGMHMFWWVFWIVAIALFFALVEAQPRRNSRKRREKPLDILQKRYAAGELTTEEYEKRKSILERDAQEDR